MNPTSPAQTLLQSYPAGVQLLAQDVAKLIDTCRSRRLRTFTKPGSSNWCLRRVRRVERD